MTNSQASKSAQASDKSFFRASTEDFKKISGSPIAYWIGERFRAAFQENGLGSISISKQGLATGDNDRFLRFWHETSFDSISWINSNLEESKSMIGKWVPYSKGGSYRKWYGNGEYIVRWVNGGEEIRQFKDENGNEKSRFRAADYYFLPAVTWSLTSSNSFGCRYRPKGSVFDINGMSLFPNSEGDFSKILALLNSKVANHVLRILNPTMAFQIGDISSVPAIFPGEKDFAEEENVIKFHPVVFARNDWDSCETSWDFKGFPLLHANLHHPTLKTSYQKLRTHWREMTLDMQRLEQENNRIFIDAYGLQDELTPDVPLNEITLTCNPHYRYGGSKSDEELEALLQADTMRELVSYAIGCMMGRYSLDEPGLVYAEAGNVGFQRLVDDGAYQSFAADGDGILPLTEDPWFEDDIAERLRAFIKLVWGEATLTENLEWLADNLGRSPGDTAMQGLRSYLARGFYKDHLKTYKRRPIYWLFSSGKHKAFECLVYLHRYHEGTLSRIRLDYVHPLLSKFDAHHQQLVREQAEATTTSEKNRLKKALAALEKKQVELADFDDRLKHYAERRIRLDLDDGVKVNYGKFGDLLAEVKAVTGGSSDD